MENNKSFLGIGWSFPAGFSWNQRQNIMAEADQDIKQSLLILLGTKPGERVMHPEYGCGINQLVFEPMSNSLFTKIQDLVEQAIILFESRVKLNQVNVEHNTKLDGTIYITIDYTIRAVNTRQNMVYPFYMLEGTNTKKIK